MPRNERIKLLIDGQTYEGWKACTVQNSISQFCGTFGAVVSAAVTASQFPIKMGSKVQLQVYKQDGTNAQTLINGYVDEMQVGYDSGSHSISISGRDKTGDLVDCTYEGSAGELKNLSAIQIINALCGPFNIWVQTDPDILSRLSVPIDKGFKIEEGVTINEIINKLAEMKNFLPVSYGDGTLHLTQAGGRGSTYNQLIGRWNILKAGWSLSDKDRFQTYIVKGTTTRDDWTATTSLAPKATQIDNIIQRYRPKVIIADSKMTVQDCVNKASFESRKRAGESRKLSITVQDWLQSDGTAWPMNSKVYVTDDDLGIDDYFIISETLFELSSENGMTCSMQLVSPDSYLVDPTPVEIKTQYDSWWSGSGRT